MRDGLKARILADDRDVGAVQCRHDPDVFPTLAKHLARDPRARCMWNRVVDVQEIELVAAHHLVHAHSEREVVRRIFKERVASDIDFVKEDAGTK